MSGDDWDFDAGIDVWMPEVSKRSARQAAAVLGLQDGTAGTFAFHLCAEAADRDGDGDGDGDNQVRAVAAVVAAQLLGGGPTRGKGKKKGGGGRDRGKDRDKGRAATVAVDPDPAAAAARSALQQHDGATVPAATAVAERLAELVARFVGQVHTSDPSRFISPRHDDKQRRWLALGLLDTSGVSSADAADTHAACAGTPSMAAVPIPAHVRLGIYDPTPQRGQTTDTTQPRGDGSARAGGCHGDGIGATAADFDLIATLPDELLVKVLDFVHCRVALCATAATCHRLRELSSADPAWLRLYVRRGWDPLSDHATIHDASLGTPAEGGGDGYTWKQRYAAKHRVVCVACSDATPYRFELLKCRLCEQCQRTTPAFRLVTRAAAVSRYMLKRGDLMDVRVIVPESRPWLRVYLEADVRAIANAKHGGPAGIAAAIERERDQSKHRAQCAGPRPDLKQRRMRRQLKAGDGDRKPVTSEDGRQGRSRGQGEPRVAAAHQNLEQREHAELESAYGHFAGLTLAN